MDILLKTAPVQIKKTQSNTDNKEIKLNHTMQEDSTSSNKFVHQNFVMSPAVQEHRLNTVNSLAGEQGAAVPQPMDSFSELKNSQRQRTIEKSGLVKVQPQQTPHGIDVLSNGYMMSSIGQVNEDPTGVNMYEMREFMNEPGASKQITSEQSKRFQLMMKKQRMIRAQAVIDRVDFVDDLELLEEGGSGRIKENSGQKHARQRQKSLETTLSRQKKRSEEVDERETLAQDFQIIKNEANGEVKLKILKKDASYVPREVLQDASIFSQVTILDISNCKIVELEGRIFMQLKNLSKLQAARNQIKYLSGRISECTSLSHINLDCNQLEMIPSEIGLLRDSLIVLKLAQNKLKHLTLSTRDLHKLEVLGIADNSLTELPEGMELLQSLKELYLSGNSFTRFNVQLGKMPKLMKVSLDWFQFLIPTMSPLVQRISKFDIKRAIRECKHGNYGDPSHTRDHKNLQNDQDFFSPGRQQDDQVQIPKSGLMRHLQNPQSLEQNVISGAIDQGITSDDEGQLLIASERNGQKVQTGCDVELQPKASIGKVTPNKHKDEIDVFKELAVLVEEECGKASGMKQQYQNGSLKGIDFIRFAERFTALQNGVKLLGKDWVSIQDAKGRTMLHYAAQKGDLAVVQALIEQGANKAKVDQYSFNPYGMALREEHFSVAMYLLTTPNFSYFDVYRGAGTFGSLLHLAVTKLQSEQVRVILEHQVSPNLTDQISGESPLHLLMNLYQKAPEKAKSILKSLSDFGVDYNKRNRDNWSPFHLAVKRGNTTAVKDMLDAAGNKIQKSWLAAKTHNADFVDIDATGGQHNVTALHLASENNFYDIVDLLFQYKADIFIEDDRGNTPFNGINNNLLMIKLLKKEQKALFNETFRQPLQAKEMHITNSIFLEQVLKSHSVNDSILAKHSSSGQYHSFKETLQHVQTQLQMPLRTHQKAIFKQQLIVEPYMKESIGVTDESQIEVLFEANSIVQDGKKSAEGEQSEDFQTIKSCDFDEKKSSTEFERKSVSPTPVSLQGFRKKQHLPINNKLSEKQQTWKDFHNKQVDEILPGQISITRNQVKQSQVIRTKSKEVLTQTTIRSTQQKFPNPKSFQLSAQPTFALGQDESSHKTVTLQNMVKQQQPFMYKFLQERDVSPVGFTQVHKNAGVNMIAVKKSPAMKNQTRPSLKNHIEGQMNLTDRNLALLGKSQILTRQTSHIPQNVNMNTKQKVGQEGTSRNHKHEVMETNNPLLEDEEYPLTMLSLQSPKVAEESTCHFGMKTIEKGNYDRMEDISETIEKIDTPKMQEIEIRPAEKQNSEITFRLQVEYQKGLSETKEKAPSNIIERYDDSADISTLENIKTPRQRQASVKVAAQNRLEIFGVSDSGKIKITVNASKNLFGSESQKLVQPAKTAYQMYSRKAFKIQKTRNMNNNETTEIQKNSMFGGLQKVRESQIAQKEHKLRDQKNIAILSQSINQKSRMNVEKGKKSMLIYTQNVPYDDEKDLIQKPYQRERKEKYHELLGNVISPTAVVDDDEVYHRGIEMPAYQPTAKLAKVISESNYSSQQRLNSQNSHKSTGTYQKPSLDQLLNHQNSHKPASTMKYFTTAQIAQAIQDPRVQTQSNSISKLNDAIFNRNENYSSTLRSVSQNKQMNTELLHEPVSDYTKIKSNLSVPQKPRLQPKKLALGEEPSPFFYKYLSREQQRTHFDGGLVKVHSNSSQQNPIPTKSAQTLISKVTEKSQEVTPNKATRNFFQ